MQKLVKTVGVLILLLELWRTGVDDNDPEVGSYDECLLFGATFVSITSLYLV